MSYLDQYADLRVKEYIMEEFIANPSWDVNNQPLYSLSDNGDGIFLSYWYSDIPMPVPDVSILMSYSLEILRQQEGIQQYNAYIVTTEFYNLQQVFGSELPSLASIRTNFINNAILA